MRTRKNSMWLILVSLVAVVLLFPRLSSLWYRNGGNLEALYNSEVVGLFSDSLLDTRRARSARVALSYIDVADQALRLGEIDAARSFWESAQRQDTDNLVVLYRTVLLRRRFVTKVNNSRSFDVHTNSDREVIWYGDFRLSTNQINRIVEGLLTIQDEWLPSTDLVMRIVDEYGWATPELYAYLADSYSHAGAYLEAISILDQLPVRFPPMEWHYLERGMIQEAFASRQSDNLSLLESSLQSYSLAYELAAPSPFALDRLVQVNRRLGRPDPAEQWEDVLEAQLTTQGPKYLVNRQITQEWVFFGYDVQEQLLGLGNVAPACLWWSHSGMSDLSKWEGYRLSGGTLVQCYQVTNLITNGAFELDGRSGPMFPIGFESDLYGAPLELHGLSPDSLGERNGMIAWLSNKARHRYTSLVSTLFAIDSNAVYLQAAWVRSYGGQAFLGRMWAPSGDYDYVANGNPAMWTHWAGLAFPPPGTISARVWLLNYDNEGTAYFDNLLFAKARLPQTVSRQP